VHPFFQGLDFKKLRQMSPPIKPVVGSTKREDGVRWGGYQLIGSTVTDTMLKHIRILSTAL
jgi:hypothetical protein